MNSFLRTKEKVVDSVNPQSLGSITANVDFAKELQGLKVQIDLLHFKITILDYISNKNSNVAENTSAPPKQEGNYMFTSLNYINHCVKKNIELLQTFHVSFSVLGT